MYCNNRIERRRLLCGWWKWALLPVLLFSVFFFDAWLNIQNRYKDYELSRLSVIRRKLNVEWDVIRAEEARISGIKNLSEMAVTLQLESPEPHQFRTIICRDLSRCMPVMNLAAKAVPFSHPALAETKEPVPVISPKTPSLPICTVPVSTSVEDQQMAVVSPADTVVQASMWSKNQSDMDMELTVEDMLAEL
ncbi:MAG: hypothetical protein KAH38_09700 [Candidatus Hydrogenedentes bacterium]|nr:hypothetical protein [Candidatus Hydrogenedentota bacterium]